MSYVETSGPIATVCVPSVVADLHKAHMARLKRFQIAAASAKPAPPPIEPPVKIPSKQTWEDRQRAIPIPKGPWFSIVKMDEVKREYPSIQEIQAACAKHYGVTRHDITSKRRTANIVMPRMVGVYLAKTMTPRSYPEIGRMFGGRDHTTAIHAFRKIEFLLKTDGDLAEAVASIKEVLA